MLRGLKTVLASHGNLSCNLPYGTNSDFHIMGSLRWIVSHGKQTNKPDIYSKPHLKLMTIEHNSEKNLV